MSSIVKCAACHGGISLSCIVLLLVCGVARSQGDPTVEGILQKNLKLFEALPALEYKQSIIADGYDDQGRPNVIYLNEATVVFQGDRFRIISNVEHSDREGNILMQRIYRVSQNDKELATLEGNSTIIALHEFADPHNKPEEAADAQYFSRMLHLIPWVVGSRGKLIGDYMKHVADRRGGEIEYIGKLENGCERISVVHRASTDRQESRNGSDESTGRTGKAATAIHLFDADFNPSQGYTLERWTEYLGGMVWRQTDIAWKSFGSYCFPEQAVATTYKPGRNQLELRMEFRLDDLSVVASPNPDTFSFKSLPPDPTATYAVEATALDGATRIVGYLTNGVFDRDPPRLTENARQVMRSVTGLQATPTDPVRPDALWNPTRILGLAVLLGILVALVYLNRTFLFKKSNI